MQYKLFAEGSIYTPRVELQKPTLPGAWACIITDTRNQTLNELCLAEMTTTHHRIELKAVVNGLNLIKIYSDDAENHVQICSHSSQVFGAILTSLPEKSRAHFLNESTFRQRLLNQANKADQTSDMDLRKSLTRLLGSFLNVTFVDITHGSEPSEHRRCHALAAQARLQLTLTLGYTVRGMSTKC